MQTYSCKHGTYEVRTDRSGVQGQPQLHMPFKKATGLKPQQPFICFPWGWMLPRAASGMVPHLQGLPKIMDGAGASAPILVSHTSWKTDISQTRLDSVPAQDTVFL